MATVVKTIGTGGDYSTLQAWEDAAPVNLVSSTTIWEGQCLNETFVVNDSSIQLTGSTSSSLYYKHLTAAPGASFGDVSSNKLIYSSTAGQGAVLAKGNAKGLSSVVELNENYSKLSRLKLYTTSIGTTVSSTTGTICYIDSCILKSTTRIVASIYTVGSVISNTLCETALVSYSYAALSLNNGAAAENCTLINFTNSTGMRAFVTSGSTCPVRNSAVFGYENISGSNTAATNCYTDSYANESGYTRVDNNTTTGSGFKALGEGTGDYRLVSTSAMIDKGVVTSSGSKDCYGTTRPQGSAYDVGAWEYLIPTVTHTTSGVVTGNPANVAGTAKRFRSHPTSGILTGGLGTIVGAARRSKPVTHTSSGVLTGGLANVVGQANKIHTVLTHATTGIVKGLTSNVVGKALNGVYNVTKRSTTAVPYHPAPPPASTSTQEQLTRSVWDELNKLRDIIASIDIPNMITVTSQENITIGTSTTVPLWNTLFNNNAVLIYSMPTGTFSPATGAWTAPQEGIYQVSCQISLPKNDLAGTNNYYAELRCTVDPYETNKPNITFQRINGGNEEVPISVTLISAVRCYKGDKVYMELAATNPKGASTVLADCSWTIIRQSGLDANA